MKEFVLKTSSVMINATIANIFVKVFQINKRIMSFNIHKKN